LVPSGGPRASDTVPTTIIKGIHTSVEE